MKKLDDHTLFLVDDDTWLKAATTLWSKVTWKVSMGEKSLKLLHQDCL